MERVVTAAQMRAAESKTAAMGTSLTTLMQNAGAAAARIIAEGIERGGATARVLILCGPGNNGGDGVVVAEQLAAWGQAVAVYTIGRAAPAPGRSLAVRHEDDPELTALRRMLDSATVVVDALLGIGHRRPIEGVLAAVLDLVRAADPPRAIVALDLPSGVDADSGAADPHTLPATITITFGYLKRGLLLGAGAALAGHIVTAEIGLTAEAAEAVALYRVDAEEVQARLPRRARDANKYSAGAVLVVAGSRRFTGAPQLATLAAARTGAGLVTLAIGASAHPIVATRLLEPTFLVLPDDAEGALDPEAALAAIGEVAGRYRSLLIGPGLAQGERSRRLIEGLLCSPVLPDGLPIVVDAEGLNALAQLPEWPGRVRHRLVLTPHSGEMARLCGGDSREIEARRCDLAVEKAQAWGQVVVLKGNPTVTAGPDGGAVLNSSGGPNLASGGTGDVLGGVIAALLAQGADPVDAALAGVYLHGRTGDLLAQRHGDRGTLASDLLAELPGVIKAVLAGEE